jgi:prepilin-type processing-associated H-X9-DG protein
MIEAKRITVSPIVQVARGLEEDADVPPDPDGTVMDANINDPVADTDPRQDDYDIWLGTLNLDKWIPWNRHGTSNVLYLDGHAKSVIKPDAYLGMYHSGQILTNPRWCP